MKKQIRRLSPHQCAKVVAIVTAITSVIVVIPMLGLTLVTVPEGVNASLLPGPLAGMMIAMPLIYGVLSYLGTLLVCVLYNLVASKTGGLEFEIRSDD